MISRISLRNFKGFDEVSLELAPLTFLLGPNNSGKSSIIASLRLLAQTVDSSDSSVPLLLNGSMGDFGTYRDIVFGNHRGRPIHIGIGFTLQGKRMYRGFDEEVWHWDTSPKKRVSLDLEYKYRVQRREIILREIQVKEDGRIKVVTRFSEDSERQVFERIGPKVVPSSLKATLSRTLRMQNFIPTPGMSIRFLLKEGESKKFLTGEVEKALSDVTRIARNITMEIRNIDYLGAMRVPPSRTYLFTGERRHRIGASGENTASILAMDSARRGARSRRIANRVSEWMRKSGIAEEIRVTPISDRHYEIRVKHPSTDEFENIADVGYGISQVMPVLVGGYNMTPGTMYLLEEPEIHLHPRAQSELGDFFLNLYRGGIQVLTETHSEHLILRMQQHVAKGLISPNHIRIYYVYPKEGKKVVKLLRLDELGRFLDEWPLGFFSERLEEAKELARIRYTRETHDGSSY